MEYYKIRLKLAKKILPKLKDEELQWKAVKKLVSDGKAEIVSMINSEDDFSRPDGLPEFPEWDKKLTTDYHLDFSILLSDEEIASIESLNKKLFEYLEKCNILQYSFQDDNGRYESWARFDDTGFNEAELINKLKNKAAEKKPGKQIDMFKKGKSK